MHHIPGGTNEAHLLDSEVGYDVLDAMVQANVDLKSVTLDELNQMVVQFSTHRHRKSVANLIRDRKRPTSEKSSSGSDDHAEPLVVRSSARSRARVLRQKIHFS